MNYIKTTINNTLDALLFGINIIPKLFTQKTTYIVVIAIVLLNIKHLERLALLFIGAILALYLYGNYRKSINTTPKVEIKEVTKAPLEFNLTDCNFSDEGNGCYSILNASYQTDSGVVVKELSISVSNQRQDLDINLFDETGNFITCLNISAEVGAMISDEFINKLLKENIN
ncbi:TPA: hypothetical protein ACF0PM_002163 [Clostridium perfringens]